MNPPVLKTLRGKHYSLEYYLLDVEWMFRPISAVRLPGGGCVFFLGLKTRKEHVGCPSGNFVRTFLPQELNLIKPLDADGRGC